MLKTVTTKAGTVYRLEGPRPSGFWNIEGNPTMIVGFAGDHRLALCEDLMKGKRKILLSTDPNGNKAMGFSGSTATISGTAPRKGFKMLIVNSGKPVRFSTEIVSVV